MTTFKDFQHFFNQLWHSYHARYKIPYAQDDKENFARRLWDWITNQKGYEKHLPSEEEIETEVYKVIEDFSPSCLAFDPTFRQDKYEVISKSIAKAISKRIGK